MNVTFTNFVVHYSLFHIQQFSPPVPPLLLTPLITISANNLSNHFNYRDLTAEQREWHASTLTLTSFPPCSHFHNSVHDFQHSLLRHLHPQHHCTLVTEYKEKIAWPTRSKLKSRLWFASEVTVLNWTTWLVSSAWSHERRYLCCNERIRED